MKTHWVYIDFSKEEIETEGESTSFMALGGLTAKQGGESGCLIVPHWYVDKNCKPVEPKDKKRAIVPNDVMIGNLVENVVQEYCRLHGKPENIYVFILRRADDPKAIALMADSDLHDDLHKWTAKFERKLKVET